MTLGWIGNAFVVVGLWWLSPKARWPFLATAIGEAIWAIHGWRTSQIELTFICVVFAFLAIRNYMKWGQGVDHG